MSIEEVLNKLDGYWDKLFCVPLSKDRISSIEHKLCIVFPDDYFYYLNRIGLLQDLNREHMIEVEAELLLENDFIKNIVKDNPEIYFAIGKNELGDLIALKDKGQNDNYLYNISHVTGKIKKSKYAFHEYISRNVDKFIKNYNNRNLNSDKYWCVQFTFQTKNEQFLINILKNEYEINFNNDWNHIEISPTNASIYKMIFEIEKQEYVLSKMESEKWETPVYSFNFKESVLILKNGSKIENFHSLFLKNAKQLGYKLVDYGIL